MNYKKIYDNIIKRRQLYPLSGYTENHHIIPKCLGGNDNIENMVRLSAREHFICHMLLTKIYSNDKFVLPKMVKSVIMMFCTSSNQKRYIPSRRYENIRMMFASFQSNFQTGSGNSQFGTFWIFNPDLKLNKKISKDQEIPDRWYKGRIDFKKNIIEIINGNLQITNIINQHRLNNSNEKRRMREKEKLIKTKMYSEWYSIYNTLGFEKFVEQTDYDKSQPNLVQLFKKYVPEFVPQNRKRRGI